MPATLIVYNGQFRGFGVKENTSACAIEDQRFLQFGTDAEILKLKEEKTQVIDLKGKLVIPGLNDSHLHLIRGGLSFNMELRWDGIKTLSEALQKLKEQVQITPPPQWVRVVGGWSEFQFKEKRMPTLKEINAISKETPIFILHLYDRALLNQAALRAIGFDKNTKEMPGTKIERDEKGNPTGMLIASPNASILYSTLALGPKLNKEQQIHSTLLFMRELNRLGVTSVCDAGGGFQRYPEDYAIIEELDIAKKLTVRIAYNLFTQRPNQELEDFVNWTNTTLYQQGSDYLHHNGAGEMLVFSAADFEDFLQPRPGLPSQMEAQLEPVVRLLAKKRWPFRLHATYDESISRALNVFEKVNEEFPLTALNWFFDHAETISDASIARVKKLGGGIAIQNRMAFQGEYFLERYGKEKTLRTPPVKKILEAGIPVGLGTDATRVSSYNPWLCLYWITTGKSLGGTKLYADADLLSREEALLLYTKGSAWFSNEAEKKGAFVEKQMADLAVISKNYFQVAEEEIKDLYSVLTIVGGKVVHAQDAFSDLNPPLPLIIPDWSPVKYQGSYAASKVLAARLAHKHLHHSQGKDFPECFCWAF